MKTVFAVCAGALWMCVVVAAQPVPMPLPPSGVSRAPRSVTAATPAEPPGSVRGVVVSSTGEPLRKAEIMLHSVGRAGGGGAMVMLGSPEVFSATTDAAGNFSLEGVPPGSYMVSAERADYSRTPTTRGRSAPTLVEVKTGQPTSGITIRMMPQSVITGKVVDEDGDSMMGAQIQVVQDRWIAGRRQQIPLRSGMTDDRGEYRIPGLVPGKYYVQVSFLRQMGLQANAPRRTDGAGDSMYVTLFYPGVPEFAQAQAVAVQPGQEARGVDFRMRKATTFRVRGQAVDESGKPVANATVMAMPEGTLWVGAGGRGMSMARGADGRFEISGLTPGTYNLTVVHGAQGHGPLFARTPVTVGNHDVDGVVVQLQPPFEISGVVRVEGEGSASIPPGMRIFAEPIEMTMGPVGVGRGANNGQVQADGTWSFGGSGSGRYRLSPSATPDGTYLKAIRAGGQDITSGAQISAAATGIEVVFGTRAPEVSGSVLNADKQPVSTGTVFLVPDAARRDRPTAYKTSGLADGGTFRFRGLAPGEYTLYAMTDVEDGAWYDPEFLRSIEGKGVPVKLTEGQNETVQVTLAQ